MCNLPGGACATNFFSTFSNPSHIQTLYSSGENIKMFLHKIFSYSSSFSSRAPRRSRKQPKQGPRIYFELLGCFFYARRAPSFISQQPLGTVRAKFTGSILGMLGNFWYAWIVHPMLGCCSGCSGVKIARGVFGG